MIIALFTVQRNEKKCEDDDDGKMKQKHVTLI